MPDVTTEVVFPISGELSLLRNVRKFDSYHFIERTNYHNWWDESRISLVFLFLIFCESNATTLIFVSTVLPRAS